MASCVRLNVKKMAKHIIGVGKLTKHGTTVLLVIFYLPTFFPTDFFISRSEIPGKFRIVFQGSVAPTDPVSAFENFDICKPVYDQS